MIMATFIMSAPPLLPRNGAGPQRVYMSRAISKKATAVVEQRRIVFVRRDLVTTTKCHKSKI
jgi:hypothetical protein